MFSLCIVDKLHICHLHCHSFITTYIKFNTGSASEQNSAVRVVIVLSSVIFPVFSGIRRESDDPAENVMPVFAEKIAVHVISV